MSDIVLAAIFLVLSSLNRYEGWGLVIAANVLMVWHWIQRKFDKRIEGAMIAFGTLSFFGIFLWLLWGTVIFHDPLEFMHNAVSAGNRVHTEVGSVTGDHNLPLAIATNLFSISHTIGNGILILATVGFSVFLIRRRNLFLSETLLIFLLLAPLFFDILTVYIGNVPVEVPELSMQVPPNNIFNIRYSLYSLPFLSLGLSLGVVLIQKMRLQTIIFISVLLFSLFLISPSLNHIAVLQDVGTGIQNYERSDVLWFRTHYSGGLILASAAENDPFMFGTGVFQENFITEGTYKIWDQALRDPQDHVEWVVISTYSSFQSVGRDQVDKFIDKDKLMKYYDVVFHGNSRTIYKLKKL